MLSIFRTNQFYGAIWLLLYFVVLSAWAWVVLDVERPPVVQHPLFERVFSFLGEGKSAWLLAGMGVIFISGLYANYAHNRFALFDSETHITGAFYLLPACLLAPFLFFNPATLATMLLVLAIMQVFKVYNEPLAAKPIFNSGLLIGTAVMFYSPFVVMALWLLVALSMLRNFTPREWLITIIGLLTPYWIAFGTFFLIDESNFFWHEVVKITLLPQSIALDAHFLKLIVLGIFGVLFLFAILNLFGLIPKKVIQVRKYLNSIVLLVPFLLATLLFTNDIGLAALYPLLVPYAFIQTLTIEHMKRQRWASFIHLTLVVITIIGQYFNFEILKYIIP